MARRSVVRNVSLAALLVAGVATAAFVAGDVAGLATGTGDEFAPVATQGGCTVYVGAIDPASGVPPMKAECHWPDVTVDDVHGVFSRLDRWQDFVWCIADSRILEEQGGRTLVWQRQSVRPLSDRENVIWMAVEETEDGYTYRWELAEVPFDAAPSSVVPGRNEGRWVVRAAPDGGVWLTNEIAYDPAGSVPSWLVRWFQTRGALQVLDGIHEAVGG